MEPQDTITIAPSVLITIVQHAATQIPGVSRMGSIPVNVGRLLQGTPVGSGVALKIDDNRVSIDVYLVVLPDVSIKSVSREVQKATTRSVEELVGMEVLAVNVHVEDVDYGALTPGG
jgi:uncharacterized alkaline shock family protein YloU